MAVVDEMGNTVREMNGDIKGIVDGISRLRIDLSGTVGQEVDEDVVKWYRDRFEMLYEDDVLIAINAYLTKANKDQNLNEITRVMILKEATSIMSRDV